MKVHVWGQSAFVDEHDVRWASVWYGKRLLGELTIEGIDLKVELTEKTARGTIGSIACLDWLNLKKFYIQLSSKCKRRKLLAVLAHEMIHMKQIVKKELVLGPNLAPVWRAERVDGVFADEPWEREAWEREASLRDELLRSVDISRN